jgi:D-alanyl-D-alanine carboxypeptidase
LEKYVGFYSSPGSLLKVIITLDATTLHAQTTGQSAFPLEATAANKFKSGTTGIVLEFDAAKNQMILNRAAWKQYLQGKITASYSR